MRYALLLALALSLPSHADGGDTALPPEGVVGKVGGETSFPPRVGGDDVGPPLMWMRRVVVDGRSRGVIIEAVPGGVPPGGSIIVPPPIFGPGQMIPGPPIVIWTEPRPEPPEPPTPRVIPKYVVDGKLVLPRDDPKFQQGVQDMGSLFSRIGKIYKFLTD